MNWNTILQDVIQVAWYTGLLYGTMLIYTIMSVIDNVKTGYDISWSWLWKGLVRRTLIAFCLFGLVVILGALDQLAVIYDWGPELTSMIDGLSLAAVVIIVIGSLANYIVKALLKLKNVFFPSEEVDVEDISNQYVLTSDQSDLTGDFIDSEETIENAGEIENKVEDNITIEPEVYTDNEVGEKDLPLEGEKVGGEVLPPDTSNPIESISTPEPPPENADLDEK